MNLLKALINIAANPAITPLSQAGSNNRANNMGDALERYVQDAFANTMKTNDEKTRLKIIQQTFSYVGNSNNPPDIMLKGGDAIEVKKIESINSDIALNSSYPKNKLDSDDPKLTASCVKCEDWKQRDIIYIVGNVSTNNLKHLWIVYGDCYAASKTSYERIKDKISSGVTSIPGVEFSMTKELGRVNKVDPLGITNLRIRGMWHISNPMKVFSYVYTYNPKVKFSLSCIIKKSKYNDFPISDRQSLEADKKFRISDIEIKNPDNPAQLIDAKLIIFEVK